MALELVGAKIGRASKHELDRGKVGDLGGKDDLKEHESGLTTDERHSLSIAWSWMTISSWNGGQIRGSLHFQGEDQRLSRVRCRTADRRRRR